MSTQLLRPPVRNLIFQLYGRPLHPELFEIYAERRACYDSAQLIIRITPTGHVISWENADVFLTEITTSESSALPEKRRLLSHRLRNEQCRSLLCAHGIHYQTSFQVEELSPEIYQQIHDELVLDGAARGFLHLFPSGSFYPPPLGLVHAHALPGCLFINCFHTFPEEHTIIKTQTLIEKK